MSKSKINPAQTTIGITALNEEKNIANLLGDIYANLSGINLKEIIIISDGSTDDTVKIAKSFTKLPIKVIDSKQRKGKSQRLNEIFNLSSTEYLICLDADIRLESRETLINLVSNFKKDKKISLVSGISKPLKPTSTPSKIAQAAIDVWNEVKKISKSQVLLSEGQIKAFRKNLYKKLKYVDTSADDVYPYYKNHLLGYGFVSESKSIIRFKLPQTFSDYISQWARYAVSKNVQKRDFGSVLVENSYKVNWLTKFSASLKYIRSNPIYFFLYLLTYPIVIIKSHLIKPVSKWEVISTSK